MTQPSATHTPSRDVRPIPRGTTETTDTHGNRTLLVPCSMCGATIPTALSDWDNALTGPHQQQHYDFHEDLFNAARGRS